MKKNPPLKIGVVFRGRISGRRKADIIKTIQSFLKGFDHRGRTYRDGLILFFLPASVTGSLQLMEALEDPVSKLNSFCTSFLEPSCSDPKSRDFAERFIRGKQALIFVRGGRRERKLLRKAKSKKKFAVEFPKKALGRGQTFSESWVLGNLG